MPEEVTSRKERVSGLVAQRRENLKRKAEALQLEEERTTERFSGLRIAQRCFRAEKWAAAMTSKVLLPFHSVAALSSPGQDYVLIGVLCEPPAFPAVSHTGEAVAEWILCDLDTKQPRRITLVLAGGATEHWACSAAVGRPSATVGSILAVLNPKSCKNDRAVRVTAAGQVVKLGMCPALAFCTALGRDGKPCRAPYNAESGQGSCPLHIKQDEHDSAAAPGLAVQARTGWLGKPRVAVLKPTAPPAMHGAAAGAAPLQGRTGGAVTVERDQMPEQDIEAAAQVVLDPKPPTEELLAALQLLEGASVEKGLLQRWGLYEGVGSLVCRPDRVGVAASRLRRRWRALLNT